MSEKAWPTRFGTLGERVFGKDDPFNDGSGPCLKYIHDEMEPTKNPLNPREIYTSKAKLRQAYKAAGVDEIGDAYDRGYSPEKEAERMSNKFAKDLAFKAIERYRNGR